MDYDEWKNSTPEERRDMAEHWAMEYEDSHPPYVDTRSAEEKQADEEFERQRTLESKFNPRED